jgi:hypothetical protein
MPVGLYGVKDDSIKRIDCIKNRGENLQQYCKDTAGIHFECTRTHPDVKMCQRPAHQPGQIVEVNLTESAEEIVPGRFTRSLEIESFNLNGSEAGEYFCASSCNMEAYTKTDSSCLETVSICSSSILLPVGKAVEETEPVGYIHEITSTQVTLSTSCGNSDEGLGTSTAFTQVELSIGQDNSILGFIIIALLFFLVISTGIIAVTSLLRYAKYFPVQDGFAVL